MAKVKCFILFPVFDEGCPLSVINKDWPAYIDDEPGFIKFMEQIRDFIELIQNIKEVELFYDYVNISAFINEIKPFKEDYLNLEQRIGTLLSAAESIDLQATRHRNNHFFLGCK